MLVHSNPIETSLVVVDELIEVGLVQLMALLGVVERIGHRDPGGVVTRQVLGREIRPRHKVKSDDLHNAPLVADAEIRRCAMASRNRCVCSICGR